MSEENWSGGNLTEEGFKLPIFTTTNLNTNNSKGVGMNNRTSVNFVRPSMKMSEPHDYSELILEEDEIDSDEEDQEQKHSLDIMVKLKVNNRSLVEDPENPDVVYGISNADSDLVYNNQYFEDLKNKKKEIMYSNLTRISIRKIVKKMETNIMKKLGREYHLV